MTSQDDASTAAQPGAGQAAPPPAPAPPRAPQRQHRVRRTRVGGLWVGITLSCLVLLLLLIFILENSQSVSIGYFGAHGHLPLGVALLLAAVAGALLLAIPGTMRIMQLRRTARRHRGIDAASAKASQPPAPARRPGDPG
jgi:uncharacterized integral membrane protein